MIPVCTPDEMAAVDAAATEPFDVLVERAGAAVARAVLDELGGGYGRRVAVLAGRGSNGADGRVAAGRLEQRGVRCAVFDAATPPDRLPADGGHAVDLVVDAAYGTGLSRPFEAPVVAAPVLAVDLPSGLDGLTGEALGNPLPAVRTVTFAALKPGLLFGRGPAVAGRVEVVDLGLDVSGATVHLVEDSDVAALVPARPVDAHKWESACWVVAGSPGMEGAAGLATTAALRAGSGYVRLTSAGLPRDGVGGVPEEVVRADVQRFTADSFHVDDVARFAAVVSGPGLGVGRETVIAVDAVLKAAEAAGRPVVVDGDGLRALADLGSERAALSVATVLTPHDGEFAHLTGGPPGPDRIAAARSLATDAGAVVLLKGPTTVVATPDGRVLLAASGDARLATAGSGDVLSGIIGAFMARGAQPFEAAAAAAHVHGRLVSHEPLHSDLDPAPTTGVAAADLAARLVRVLEDLGVDAPRIGGEST